MMRAVEEPDSKNRSYRKYMQRFFYLSKVINNTSRLNTKALYEKPARLFMNSSEKYPAPPQQAMQG